MHSSRSAGNECHAGAQCNIMDNFQQVNKTLKSAANFLSIFRSDSNSPKTFPEDFQDRCISVSWYKYKFWYKKSLFTPLDQIVVFLLWDYMMSERKNS